MDNSGMFDQLPQLTSEPLHCMLDWEDEFGCTCDSEEQSIQYRTGSHMADDIFHKMFAGEC